MNRKGDTTPRRYAEQGERLRAAREAVKLSRDAVAAEVVPGAKREGQTVYEWEAGAATPTVAQLAHLCRLYNVSADHLLGLPERDEALSLEVIGQIADGKFSPEALARFEQWAAEAESALDDAADDATPEALE